MNKLEIVKARTVDKNEIHAALDIVVAPYFMWLHIAFIRFSFHIVGRTVQNIHATTIRPPSFAIGCPELFVADENPLLVLRIIFIERSALIHIPVTPELREKLLFWF